MKNCIFYILLLWLTGTCCFGQQMQTITYTTKEGLISNQLSAIHIDKKGNIWTIGDAEGIGMYDGKKFRTYPNKDLTKFIPRKIIEDAQGRVSILSVNFSSFVRFQNDSLQLYEPINPKNYKAIFEEANSKQICIVNLQNQLFYFDEQLKTFIQSSDFFPDVEETGYRYTYDSITKKHEFSAVRPDHPFQIYKQWAWQNHELPQLVDNIRSSTFIHAVSTKKYGSVCIFRKGSFYLKKGKRVIVPELSKRNYHICGEDAENYYFDTGIRNLHEIHVFSKIDLSHKASYHFIHASQIVGATQDKFGTLWCATRHGLVRVFPQFLVCKVSDPNMLGDLHVINEDKKGNIWFGTYGNGFCYFDGKQIQPTTPLLAKIKTILPGTIRDKEGNMYFSAEDDTRSFKTDGSKLLETWGKFGYYFTMTNTGGIALGQSNLRGLYIKEKNKPAYNLGKEKGLGLGNVITVTQDRYNRFWMARPSEGVAVYLPDRDTILTYAKTADTTNNFGAWSSTIDYKGNLWMGTSRGLAFYPIKEKLPPDFYPFKDFIFVGKTTIGTGNISYLKCYKSRYLAIGDRDKGLKILDLRHFYEGNIENPRFYQFPSSEAFVNQGTEQNAVYVDTKGNLWSGHNQGATRINWDTWQIDTLPPKVTIDSIRTGKRSFLTKDTSFVLDPEETSIKIKLETDLLPYLYDNVQLFYKLNSEKMQSIDEKAITLSYLDQREHHLEIIAVKNGVVYSIRAITLNIRPYWWKRWWVWAIFTLATLIIAYYWVRNQRNHEIDIKDKEILLQHQQIELQTTEKEKSQLQAQTIVNQLNPHFINNTLSWIKAKVKNDPELEEGIINLSESIRIIFANSIEGKVHHTLKEEIILVSHYLFIQNKRFGSKIQYILPSEDDDIIQKLGQVEIFLMLIQIHCENAIEHGIKNTPTGEGFVCIKIMDELNYIKIIIEDNGVGRAVAKKMGSRGTQRGVKMIKGLEEIFNRMNTLHITSEYEDLIFQKNDGSACGTRIVITIPKIYSYHIK